MITPAEIAELRHRKARVLMLLAGSPTSLEAASAIPKWIWDVDAALREMEEDPLGIKAASGSIPDPVTGAPSWPSTPSWWAYELRVRNGDGWGEWESHAGRRVPILTDDSAELRNERPLYERATA